MKLFCIKGVSNCTPALDEKLVQPRRLGWKTWLRIFNISLPETSFFLVCGCIKEKIVHISLKSHNIEVKLCNPCQFLKRLIFVSCKIFCPSIISHHFTINCIWLMLVLHELKQVLVLFPSGICAKLRTVAASNNRVHMPWSPKAQPGGVLKGLKHPP